jgi:hypothetical protein
VAIKLDISAEFQANPTVDAVAHSAWIPLIVRAAKNFVARECRMPAFPEGSAGFSRSKAAPWIDITSLSEAKLWVEVNGYGPAEVSLTQSGKTTGELVRAELEAQIQALTDWVFPLVTVAYGTVSGDNVYTITAPGEGEWSYVNVTYRETENALARTLGLGPDWGGVEVPGTVYDEDLHEAAIALCIEKYLSLGVEGLLSGTTPGGVQFTKKDIPGEVSRILNSKRKLGV